MSANNWSQCPQCMDVAEAEKAALVAEAAEAYGNVPEDEYTQLRERAEKDITLEDTMREDYELGVNLLGVFRVGFSASCSTCGYRFEFEHEEATREAK